MIFQKKNIRWLPRLRGVRKPPALRRSRNSHFHSVFLLLWHLCFLVKWGWRNRPYARRELKSGHVVPTHPPVTTVGHLPSGFIADQICPYVEISSYSYAGRRIRSKCTHILMRVDHASLGRGHFIAQNYQPTNPKIAEFWKRFWPILRGVFFDLSHTTGGLLDFWKNSLDFHGSR